MKHSNSCMSALFATGLVLPVAAAADDPRLRDEGISGTVVTVDYEQRGDGLYEYVYTLETPASNKGSVTAMYLDLQCDKGFEPANLPAPQESVGYFGNKAEEGTISPSTILADYGAAANWGISPAGQAFWGRQILPGSTVTGMRLVSPAEPGMRKYVLKPEWDADPDKWSYPEVITDDIPWVEDFMVEGMVAAPGCPGVTDPVELPSYPGLQRNVESEEINELLSWREPLRDVLQVDAAEFVFTVIYGENIDPSTFKVQPGYLRRYFDPRPGAEETVTVPLKKDRMKIMFEVHPVGDNAPRKDDDQDHSYKDRDVFEIRQVGTQGGAK